MTPNCANRTKFSELTVMYRELSARKRFTLFSWKILCHIQCSATRRAKSEPLLECTHRNTAFPVPFRIFDEDLAHSLPNEVQRSSGGNWTHDLGVCTTMLFHWAIGSSLHYTTPPSDQRRALVLPVTQLLGPSFTRLLSWAAFTGQ